MCFLFVFGLSFRYDFDGIEIGFTFGTCYGYVTCICSASVMDPLFMPRAAIPILCSRFLCTLEL